MINVKLKTPEHSEKKFLDIQKTLNGDYILREHPDIDIVVIPDKFKVLILTKRDLTEPVYKLQEKLFSFLSKKGVILPETVKGGNVFGSLEATYPQSPPGGENPLQVVVYAISNFIDQERPEYLYHQEYQKTMEDYLLHPENKDSTELGEVPHENKQGTVSDYPNSGKTYQYMMESMNINLEEGLDTDKVDIDD